MSNKTGDVLTIERGKDGTVAREWPTGTFIEARLTKVVMDNLAQLDGTQTFAGDVNTQNLDVTGNISVSGTVDGRDVAADGAKLDAIDTAIDTSANATAIIIDEFENVNFVGTIFTDGAVISGVDDSLRGFFKAYGGGAGGNFGGTIQLFTAADWDTTINYYQINPFQDELHIGSIGGSGTAIIIDDINTLFGGDVDIQGNFTSLGIDDNAASTAITIDTNSDIALVSDMTLTNGNLTIISDNTILTDFSGAGTNLFQHIGNTGATSGIRQYSWSATSIGTFILQARNDAKGFLRDIITFDHATADTIFGGNVSLADNKTLNLGTDNDLILTHTGADAALDNHTGTFFMVQRVNAGTLALASYDSGGTYKNGILIGGSTPNARLHYDGSEKLKTTSSGISLAGATNPTIEFDSNDYFHYNDTLNYLSLLIGGVVVARIDASSTTGETCLQIYDVDNATLERVTVGAADSGGAGYKALRIPN